MVRKKALKRLLIQGSLFLIACLIFGNIFVPTIIVYILRCIYIRGASMDEESLAMEKDIKDSMTLEGQQSYEDASILSAIAIPLIPTLIIHWFFPQYKYIEGIIALLTFFFMIINPSLIDIVLIITNDEEKTEKFRKFEASLTTIIVVACIAYIIFGIASNKISANSKKNKLNAPELWKEYISENSLDPDYSSALDECEIDFEKDGSSGWANTLGKTAKENGLFYNHNLYIKFEYDNDNKEWNCTHELTRECLYELYENITWTGKGKDGFGTLLGRSDERSYTLTLNAGKMGETTGHFTITEQDGTLVAEYDVTTKPTDSVNKFIIDVGQDMGWYVTGFVVEYDGETNTFNFADDNIEGSMSMVKQD